MDYKNFPGFYFIIFDNKKILPTFSPWQSKTLGWDLAIKVLLLLGRAAVDFGHLRHKKNSTFLRGVE